MQKVELTVIGGAIPRACRPLFAIAVPHDGGGCAIPVCHSRTMSLVHAQKVSVCMHKQ